MIQGYYFSHFKKNYRRSGVSPRFAPGTALLRLCFVVVLMTWFYPAMPANADEIRPALLDIKKQNTGLFAVTWKVPKRGDRVLALTPRLPDSLQLLGSSTIQDIPGARIERSTYKTNDESLIGETIFIDGLSALQTDLLLLIQLQNGTQHSSILRPGSPQFSIPLEASKLEIAGALSEIGVPQHEVPLALLMFNVGEKPGRFCLSRLLSVL